MSEQSEQGEQEEQEGYDEITAEVRASLPHAREDYEPVFDRQGTTHRVLAQITDLVDSLAGNQPRNTIDALALSMMLDDVVPGVPGPMDGGTLEDATSRVQAEVDKLIEAGFVEEREDGTLALTDDGLVELTN